MEDAVFIKILEFGEQCGIEGTRWEDLKSWLQEKDIIPTDENLSKREENRVFRLYSECFDAPHGGGHTDRLLKTEYYFRLIEFRELQESRTASRDANRNSFIAIALSVFAIIASASLTYKQLNTPISIASTQIKELISASVPPERQEVYLNTSQLEKLEAFYKNTQLKEVRLSETQLEQILTAINPNKPIQATANASVSPPSPTH